MYYLAGVVATGILSVSFCCCITLGFKSLKLAIDVIDAAADFLATTKRVMLVPIMFFFLTLILILVWMSAFACICSMNEIKADTAIIP